MNFKNINIGMIGKKELAIIDIILPKQTRYFIDYNILEAESGNFETGDTVYILKDKTQIIKWLNANSTSDSPHIMTLDKNNFLNAIRSLKLQKLNI